MFLLSLIQHSVISVGAETDYSLRTFDLRDSVSLCFNTALVKWSRCFRSAASRLNSCKWHTTHRRASSPSHINTLLSNTMKRTSDSKESGGGEYLPEMKREKWIVADCCSAANKVKEFHSRVWQKDASQGFTPAFLSLRVSVGVSKSLWMIKNIDRRFVEFFCNQEQKINKSEISTWMST